MQLLKVSLVVSLTLIIIGCSTVEPPAPIGDIPTVEVPTPTIEGDIEVEVSQNAPSLVTPTIDPVPTPNPGPTSTAVPHSTITSSLTPTPTPTVPAPSEPRIAGSVQFEVDVATVVSETELSEQGFSRINAPA